MESKGVVCEDLGRQYMYYGKRHSGKELSDQIQKVSPCLATCVSTVSSCDVMMKKHAHMSTDGKIKLASSSLHLMKHSMLFQVHACCNSERILSHTLNHRSIQ